MELHQLKTFVTIVKVGNFTRTAELLKFAQSSVSAQVKALEDELETKLFERLGREVSLTEDGKRLLVYAEQILKLAEEAKDLITGSSAPKGTLTIGAPESLCVFRLPPLLQEYRRRFPKVKLILKLGNCCDIYNWVGKNLIDIAFLLDTPISANNLIAECLIHEPITLFSGSSHPLTGKDSCEPRDIKGENLIFIEEEGCCYRMIFETQLAKAGIQPESVLELGSVESIKKCVASGLGIAVLPRMAIEKELTSGELTDLHWNNPDFNIYTQMVYHKDKWLSPALSALMQLAREILKS